MAQPFTETQSAIDNGLENAPPQAGAQLARQWASELQGAGATELTSDLESLATELEAGSPDTGRISMLLQKLGPATVAAADQCQDASVGEKVRMLGQQLSMSDESAGTM